MLVGLGQWLLHHHGKLRGIRAARSKQAFRHGGKDALIDACQYYLDHPDECAGIATAGRNSSAQNCARRPAVPRFCRLSNATITASQEAELRRTPIFALRHYTSILASAALPRELRGALLEKKSFWNALRKDLLELNIGDSAFRPKPVPSTGWTRASSPGMSRQNAPVIVQRRQEQESRLNAGEQVWTIHENAEFARAPAPQISVLITLYNYASFIEGCIDAIDRSADLLAVPIEILIVDDASTDDSLARARRVQNRLARPFALSGNVSIPVWPMRATSAHVSPAHPISS